MEPAPKKVVDGDDNNDTLGIDSVLTFRATFYGLWKIHTEAELLSDTASYISWF